MVTVYFGTNRNFFGGRTNLDFGQEFNPDGPAAIRFGMAEVPESCFGDNAKLKDIRIEVAPESIDVTQPTEVIVGSHTVFQTLQDKMRRHSRDTVVFVHGYANTFRNALRHAAWLKAAYSDVPFNMFLFSWPSKGRMVPFMSYHSDRHDAKASGQAMARTFLKLRDFLQANSPEDRCNCRLHLIAHSMGNYAFRHALQGIRTVLGDKPPRLFDNILLVAADEDDDAFEQDYKLRLVSRFGRQVNVYFNPGDQALLVSDATKRNPDRLGSDGPRLLDDLPRKVVLLNCHEAAKTDERDRCGHDYHRYSKAVIADITEVLKGTPPDQIPGRRYVPATRSFRIVPAPDRATTPIDALTDGNGPHPGASARALDCL